MIEISTTLARFWGSLFMLLGLLSLGAGFLGRVIGYTEDKSITVSTGYITFLLGLGTVVLHNVWVADWRVAITLLGWITLLKGIEKIGFPDRIHRRAQMFRSMEALWSVVIFLLGAWLFWMSVSSSSVTPLGGDRDEHGCIPSAGYQWCEAKQKCLRIWEESCDGTGTGTSSWQHYQNDTLGFSLKFPPSWNGFNAHQGEFPTYRYVGFSFSDPHRPFEIFKVVQYSQEEWARVGKAVPFVVLDSTVFPPLVCDGCCAVSNDGTGGGQFDAFQQERCKEVPEILRTFESSRR